MQQELLREILAQNKTTCSYAFNSIADENSGYRLSEQSASVGFVYRHIGETMNLFGLFLGIQTDVQNTTINQLDVGQKFDIEASRLLIEQGYKTFETVIATTLDAEWLSPIETPFFGTVSKMRLFSHILFHTSFHAGQISLILAKGRKFN